MQNNGLSLKTKKIYVFENGRQYSNIIFVSHRFHHSFNALLQYISIKLQPRFGAVRNLYLRSGKLIESFKDLSHEGKYVACGKKRLKRICGGYRTTSEMVFKPPTEYYPTEALSDNEKLKYPCLVESMRKGRTIIYVFLNGHKTLPKKIVLIKQDFHQWEFLLKYIANALDIPEGIIGLHTIFGQKVCSPQELQHGGYYVALPVGTCFKPATYLRVESFSPRRKFWEASPLSEKENYINATTTCSSLDYRLDPCIKLQKRTTIPKSTKNVVPKKKKSDKSKTIHPVHTSLSPMSENEIEILEENLELETLENQYQEFLRKVSSTILKPKVLQSQDTEKLIGSTIEYDLDGRRKSKVSDLSSISKELIQEKKSLSRHSLHFLPQVEKSKSKLSEYDLHGRRKSKVSNLSSISKELIPEKRSLSRHSLQVLPQEEKRKSKLSEKSDAAEKVSRQSINSRIVSKSNERKTDKSNKGRSITSQANLDTWDKEYVVDLNSLFKEYKENKDNKDNSRMVLEVVCDQKEDVGQSENISLKSQREPITTALVHSDHKTEKKIRLEKRNLPRGSLKLLQRAKKSNSKLPVKSDATKKVSKQSFSIKNAGTNKLEKVSLPKKIKSNGKKRKSGKPNHCGLLRSVDKVERKSLSSVASLETFITCCPCSKTMVNEHVVDINSVGLNKENDENKDNLPVISEIVSNQEKAEDVNYNSSSKCEEDSRPLCDQEEAKSNPTSIREEDVGLLQENISLKPQREPITTALVHSDPETEKEINLEIGNLPRGSLKLLPLAEKSNSKLSVKSDATELVGKQSFSNEANKLEKVLPQKEIKSKSSQASLEMVNQFLEELISVVLNKENDENKDNLPVISQIVSNQEKAEGVNYDPTSNREEDLGLLENIAIKPDHATEKEISLEKGNLPIGSLKLLPRAEKTNSKLSVKSDATKKVSKQSFSNNKVEANKLEKVSPLKKIKSNGEKRKTDKPNHCDLIRFVDKVERRSTSPQASLENFITCCPCSKTMIKECVVDLNSVGLNKENDENKNNLPRMSEIVSNQEKAEEVNYNSSSICEKDCEPLCDQEEANGGNSNPTSTSKKDVRLQEDIKLKPNYETEKEVSLGIRNLPRDSLKLPREDKSNAKPSVKFDASKKVSKQSCSNKVSPLKKIKSNGKKKNSGKPTHYSLLRPVDKVERRSTLSQADSKMWVKEYVVDLNYLFKEYNENKDTPPMVLEIVCDQEKANGDNFNPTRIREERVGQLENISSKPKKREPRTTALVYSDHETVKKISPKNGNLPKGSLKLLPRKEKSNSKLSSKSDATKKVSKQSFGNKNVGANKLKKISLPKEIKSCGKPNQYGLLRSVDKVEKKSILSQASLKTCPCPCSMFKKHVVESNSVRLNKENNENKDNLPTVSKIVFNQEKAEGVNYNPTSNREEDLGPLKNISLQPSNCKCPVNENKEVRTFWGLLKNVLKGKGN